MLACHRLCPASPRRRRRVLLSRRHCINVTEINRIHLVLFDVNNRTFGRQVLLSRHTTNVSYFVVCLPLLFPTHAFCMSDSFGNAMVLLPGSRRLTRGPELCCARCHASMSVCLPVCLPVTPTRHARPRPPYSQRCKGGSDGTADSLSLATPGSHAARTHRHSPPSASAGAPDGGNACASQSSEQPAFSPRMERPAGIKRRNSCNLQRMPSIRKLSKAGFGGAVGGSGAAALPAAEARGAPHRFCILHQDPLFMIKLQK
jgi:hypothetical protein